MTRRTLEVETLAAFDTHVRQGSRRLNGWFVQSVDLTARSATLAGVDPRGAVFLGCRFAPEIESSLRERGALLFPRLPEAPFDPYRPGLYDAAELYGSGRYQASTDAAVYAWSQAAGHAPTLQHSLAAALHDHAITDALDEATLGVDPRTVVGVMGGHALVRGEDDYRRAVELGRRLAAAGRTVLTGGGPGAMEAANLGAYLSPWPDAVDEALAILSAAPSYRPSIEDWIQTGRAVRSRWPVEQAGKSLGIPTWFYGHEPTNVFATAIAKYFANALREDTLLHRCRGGIVYLTGQAGTVQEIFQAGTENFYAASAVQVAPMVLVGVEYWTKTLPAYPLLRELARGRAMERAVHCVDSIEEASALLLGPPD